MQTQILNEFPLDFNLAYAKPKLQGRYKVEPDDFQVVENLGFEPSGEGEHICVLVEKRGLNTADVCSRFSKLFTLPKRDISYAGLKDRQALTRQWFSLRVNVTQSLDFTPFQSENLRIIKILRNNKKIKRGSHQSNSFRIYIRDFEGDVKELQNKIELIKLQGVPNYFGLQRFGRSGDNVKHAMAVFLGEKKVKDKFLRGIYLSAARAWLFNKLLSKRIEQKLWDSYIGGDVISLSGSASTFIPQEWDDKLAERLIKQDIHPSGPLWGKGALPTSQRVNELEKTLSADYSELCLGLENAGLKQERRPLRLSVLDLSYQLNSDQSLLLEFTLGKGAYATSVLRELLKLTNL